MKENTKSNTGNIHSGHRQRMRGKVVNSGAKTLEPHELLELILTYTIPRKNTNPIAHELLRTFGSISNVVDATFTDLIRIKGVGEKTAVFLNALSNLVARYNECKVDKTKEFLFTTGDVVAYFRKHYTMRNFEEMFVIATNKNGEVLKTYIIEGQTRDKIEFSIKDFVERVTSSNVCGVVVIHTHPNGVCSPTQEDIVATVQMYNACTSLGINLIDHIIVNENSHYTFRGNKLIDKLDIDKAMNRISSVEELKEYLSQVQRDKLASANNEHILEDDVIYIDDELLKSAKMRAKLQKSKKTNKI